jgi:hypothetical protein
MLLISLYAIGLTVSFSAPLLPDFPSLRTNPKVKGLR